MIEYNPRQLYLVEMKVPKRGDLYVDNTQIAANDWTHTKMPVLTPHGDPLPKPEIERCLCGADAKVSDGLADARVMCLSIGPCAYSSPDAPTRLEAITTHNAMMKAAREVRG